MGYSLNDCLSFSNGKKYPNSKGNIPIYGGNGVLGYCEESNASNCIIIGRVGVYCGSVYYEKGKSWVSDNAIMGFAKEGFDIRFLYYLLLTLNLQKRQQGTSQPLLTQGLLKSISIPRLPEISTQRRISSFLSLFDQKIELNNLINDYLSELIKTLFRYWFVDFVPFKDEVKRTSEIGDIPASMELTPLAELTVTITKGTTPTTLGHQYVNAGVNFIKGESILDDYTFDHSKFAYIDEETNTALKRSIIQDRDLLFTIAGTLGRFAMAEPGMLPANTNQAVGIIRVDPVLLAPEVLLSYFIGGWQEDYYARRVQQAVQANLNLATLKSLPVPVLKDGRRLEYERQIIPLVNAIEANATESRTLKTLRDTLLPKLMSGEIDVSGLEIA